MHKTIKPLILVLVLILTLSLSVSIKAATAIYTLNVSSGANPPDKVSNAYPALPNEIIYRDSGFCYLEIDFSNLSSNESVILECYVALVRVDGTDRTILTEESYETVDSLYDATNNIASISFYYNLDYSFKTLDDFSLATSIFNNELPTLYTSISDWNSSINIETVVYFTYDYRNLTSGRTRTIEYVTSFYARSYSYELLYLMPRDYNYFIISDFNTYVAQTKKIRYERKNESDIVIFESTNYSDENNPFDPNNTYPTNSIATSITYTKVNLYMSMINDGTLGYVPKYYGYSSTATFTIEKDVTVPLEEKLGMNNRGMWNPRVSIYSTTPGTEVGPGESDLTGIFNSIVDFFETIYKFLGSLPFVISGLLALFLLIALIIKFM